MIIRWELEKGLGHGELHVPKLTDEMVKALPPKFEDLVEALCRVFSRLLVALTCQSAATGSFTGIGKAGLTLEETLREVLNDCASLSYFGGRVDAKLLIETAIQQWENEVRREGGKEVEDGGG